MLRAWWRSLVARWRAPQPPKIWAVYERGRWCKVVTFSKPAVVSWHDRRGPFRSEVDCDEFCDAANGLTSQKQALEHAAEVRRRLKPQ